MKRLKKLGFLFSSLFFIGTIATLLNACMDVSDSENQELVTSSNEYMRSVRSDLRSFMKYRIGSGEGSRGIQWEDPNIKPPGTTVVYVDFTVDSKPEIPSGSELTPGDMLELSRHYGAEYSLEDDGMRDDSIFVSDKKAEESLHEILDNSKQFLRKRGVTDQDMKEALRLTNLNESALIPLALALAALDEEDSNYSSNSLLIFNPFVTTCHAEITVGMSINCALKATGINDIRKIVGDKIAELTVDLICRMLRIVVPKSFGYVGAAVMLVEFADCLAHYDRYADSFN